MPYSTNCENVKLSLGGATSENVPKLTKTGEKEFVYTTSILL